MNYANLYEITRRLICFQYPVLLVIVCHKTKQKYTKYMHLDCSKSSKRCFQLFFFNPCLIYQQEAAWCITHVFNFVAWCITSQDSLSEKVTPKCVSFQFYFLAYLFNNISTRDINSFKSSYIYSFMSVLDWSIMPYRKTCFVFTKPLLAPKQLIFKQSVCICKQINISQFILHTCDLSYLPWKSQKWHLHDVSRVLHEKLMYRVTECGVGNSKLRRFRMRSLVKVFFVFHHQWMTYWKTTNWLEWNGMERNRNLIIFLSGILCRTCQNFCICILKFTCAYQHTAYPCLKKEKKFYTLCVD